MTGSYLCFFFVIIIIDTRIHVDLCQCQCLAVKRKLCRQKGGEVRNLYKCPLSTDNRIIDTMHRRLFLLRQAHLTTSLRVDNQPKIFSTLEYKIMEVVIDCYFDRLFEGMERSSLASRHKRRQLVKFFSEIIRSCSEGKNL